MNCNKSPLKKSNQNGLQMEIEKLFIRFKWTYFITILSIFLFEHKFLRFI